MPNKTLRKTQTSINLNVTKYVLTFSSLLLTKLNTKQPGRLKGPVHDKWIVVTTINEPSDAMKSLANLPGWKLLAVGDLKTPTDWK